MIFFFLQLYQIIICLSFFSLFTFLFPFFPLFLFLYNLHIHYQSSPSISFFPPTNKFFKKKKVRRMCNHALFHTSKQAYLKWSLLLLLTLFILCPFSFNLIQNIMNSFHVEMCLSFFFSQKKIDRKKKRKEETYCSLFFMFPFSFFIYLFI
jgi:hypothetical protein